jgi:hypothetical protein
MAAKATKGVWGYIALLAAPRVIRAKDNQRLWASERHTSEKSTDLTDLDDAVE